MFFRAQQWAQNNGVPIITWKIQCTGAIMNYLNDSNTETEIFHKQSGLLSYFVQGAMSYITENINPKKGLANGTTVYMHSLTFSEEDMLTGDYKIFLTQIKHSSPGEHIHINNAIPKYINVKINITKDLKPLWKTYETILKDKFIIPIGFRSRTDKTKNDIRINDKLHKNKTITKQKENRVELAFVITFHKLQGKTIPNLIVELNERPFSPSITYNGFLVALSRVTHKSHLRIMPITPGSD